MAAATRLVQSEELDLQKRSIPRARGYRLSFRLGAEDTLGKHSGGSTNPRVQQFADSMDKTIEIIPEKTMRALVHHSWPGNIRELQNYIARGVILSNRGIFEPGPLETCESPDPEIADPTREERIRREIIAACESAKWRLGGPEGAAARLGLKRTTLFHKMKRLGIARPPRRVGASFK